MKKIQFLVFLPLVILILIFTAQIAMADPIDNGPPAQQQKNVVPNSTANGNYLELQDGTGAKVNENTTQALDKKPNKHQKKSSKPNSLEKGKSHNETRENGGVEVK